jgi:hypothetical protein
MSGTLSSIPALQDDITAEGFRSVNKQYLNDILQSNAKVAGCFSISAGTVPIILAPSWNRVDIWERSIQTQGLIDGLDDLVDPGGWYEIDDDTAGDYTMGGTVRFTGDLAGAYNVQIGGASVYRDSVTIVAGGEGKISFTNCIVNQVLSGEKIQMEVSGPNGAVMLITYSQFGIVR